MIKQISVFTENRKGAMKDITETVSSEGIDIYNVVTNDSAEYGIARMLLTDPDKGLDLLSKKGYMCKIDKVIGVQIPDDVGSLTKLLKDIEAININIEYLYVSYSRDSKTPLAVMKAAGYAEIEESLKSKGYVIV